MTVACELANSPKRGGATEFPFKRGRARRARRFVIVGSRGDRYSSLPMPLTQAPSPVAPPPGEDAISSAGRVLAVGAVGVAAVLGLALADRHDIVSAGVAAACVVLATWAFARGAARRAAEAVAAQGEEAPVLPAVRALEALPDPVLLISAGDPDDHAARRIDHANAAARELLRIPASGALVVAAVRRPEVLEALDETLYGRLPRRAAFETAGTGPDRYLTAWTLPLESDAPTGAEPARAHALLLLRDETEARRAERRRVDFLANASHELRTPLASLGGFIETLRGHAKDDPVARERFLGIMAAQTERMGRLTEDLLVLSRAELNEHVPPQGRCDLALVAADVADALAPVAAERRAVLSLHLAPGGAAELVGDRDQLVQAVQNLVANALKYSPPDGRVEITLSPPLPAEEALAAGEGPGPATGGARVAIVAPERESGRRLLRLSVVDAGPGIRREHLPRLAERFYRVEGQKSGERNGTGLGLAIVKHIVGRHRGGLVVESTPGVGTRMSLLLSAIGDPSAAAETKPS